MDLRSLIPQAWREPLAKHLEELHLFSLENILEYEYKHYTVYPARENIFAALEGITPEEVKVVILGQDPYHGPGQAHGLSFSVQDGVALPKSLQNIYQEMHDDLGVTKPTNGNLTKWKEQGVLLLNSTLTVREHEAASHANLGWQAITAAILRVVLETNQHKVFILWGSHAKRTFDVVHKNERNVNIVMSAHPSPLSAYRGFFGSKPFSKTNQFLQNHGLEPIQWEVIC